MLGLTESGSSRVCGLEHEMLKTRPSICRIKVLCLFICLFIYLISSSQSLPLALTKSSLKKSRVPSPALPDSARLA